MNQILESIQSRRSCRKYRSEMPDRAILAQIAEAGTYAPSGKGRQSALIVVITDRATRDMLSRWNAQIMGVDGDPFYGAPAIMLVLADKKVPTHICDGSLVMGNLMLASHSLGLGSCWINRALEEFDRPEGRDLLKKWGIDGDYVGIGHCALGWPDGEAASPAPRKPDYVRWVE